MTEILIFRTQAVEKGRDGEISLMEIELGLNISYKIIFIQTNNLLEKDPLIITFHGSINDENVDKYFEKGFIYLFISQVEPFPRKIMDVIGAGLLIISYKIKV